MLRAWAPRASCPRKGPSFFKVEFATVAGSVVPALLATTGISWRSRSRSIATSRLAMASAVQAGTAPSPVPLGDIFSCSMHRMSREALLSRFRALRPSSNGVLLFAGGLDTMRHDTDHEDIFRQESTFYYLFGVREPGYMGALDVLTGKTTLFMPRLPEEYILWMGEIRPPQDVQEHYGVDEVVYIDQIASWFNNASPECVFIQHGSNSDSGSKVRSADFPGLRNTFPVDESVLHDLIYECRVHKNSEELRLLRHVNRISADAHIEMMRQVCPNLMEYQLESIFAYSCYYNGGCRLMSYTPIVGSGPNSAILHYGHAGAPNNRRIEDGDMVLCDMGAELYCYASDITNCFPASGSFTADQKLVFQTVAAMQSAVLDSMGPGVDWAKMQELSYRVMCEQLIAAGLLKGSVDAMMDANVGGVLMPHGLGHLLGIDTHDVGGYPPGTSRDTRDGYRSLRTRRQLEPGMVITVEPGIYFIAYALDKAKADPKLSGFFNWARLQDFVKFGGIRLEDNVVITETGIENLTVAPRTVEEVEAVMRGEIANSMALLAWRLSRSMPS